VEEVLGRLKGEIEEVFRLDRLVGAIEAAIEASDPERLDAWARQRLARFLDDQPTVQRLEEVVDALVAFRKRGSDLYQRTLDAIQRRYQLSFAASYQRATTREALVDVEFDFGHPDAPGGLADQLKAAIDGRLNRRFVESIPGVTLRRGSLSHRIDRRADVALDLPWYDRTERHVARSVATVEAVEDDGRLLLYEGTATDRVSVATAKVVRDSQLTIVTRLERCPGVRNHRPGSVRCSYSLRQALTQARVSLVESQLRAFVDAYFPEAFPAAGDGETSGSFRNWLASLDRAVEELEGNGLGNLGNTLLSMHVSLAPEVASAWLDAPAAGHEVYRQMSLRLQGRLKELIPLVYFQDLRRCSPNAVDAAVLHAYVALPPSMGVRLRNDGKLVPTRDGELHWDLQDERLLRALLSTGRAERRLAETAQRFRALLAQQPGLATRKKELASDRGFAQQVRSAALPGGTPRPTLVSLLHSEREIVAAAARAGAAMARFREEAPERPREAVAALAEFGAALSRAFHKELGSLYLKEGLRPFGTLLFSEAAAAIRGGLRPATSALLQLVILRQGVTFPPEGFPDHERPAPGDILLAQNLVDR
jgi:hypothetical protein